MEDDTEDEDEDEDEDMEGQSDNDDSDQDMDQDQDDIEDNESDGESDGDEDMQIDLEQMKIEYQSKNTAEPTDSKKPSSSRVPTLALTGGFKWMGDGQNQDEEAESSSDEDDEEAGQSSKKKRKRKQIELDLTGDMHTKTPDSNADFERVLLGSPNSSFIWIQYMSFQLPLSEVDKAREIARRAIQTINFREEKERLNVWIALLNLENVYGTDDTLDAVFKEAARANDSKTIHLRLAAIFEQSDKFEASHSTYQSCYSFLTSLLLSRKQRSNTNELARSLAKAQKFGHCLVNSS